MDDAATEFKVDRVQRIRAESILVVEARRLIDEHVFDALGIDETTLDDAGLGVIRNPPHGAYVDLGHRVMMAHAHSRA
jgi:hypothetical protein